MIFIGLLLRGLYRLALRLAFLVLLLLALLKLLSFGLALWAEHHPREVEALASRLLGLPVQVEAIETGWRGFTPRIWLRGLVLGGEERLELGDVLAAVRLRALPHWPENLPVALHLEGTRLQVERDENGVTRILGLPRSGKQIAPPALLIIENASVEWHDRKRNARLVERGLDLQLLSRGGQERHLQVRSRVRDLQVLAELSGRLAAGDWSARFWVQGRDLDLGGPLAAYLPEDFRPPATRADFRAWSYWEHGRHRETRLLFHLPETRLTRRGRSALVLRDLAGDLLYRPGNERWSLRLAGFKFRAEGAPPQPDTEWALRGGREGLLLGAGTVELAAVAPLTRLLALPEEVRAALSGLAPRGRLEGLLLHLPAAGGWAARARLRELSVNPWQRLPGISGLDARLELRPHQLRLHLEARRTRIDLRPLFRRPFALDRLEGAILLRQTASGWRLDAPRLVAENSDLRTLTRLHLSREGEGPLFADIQSDFRDGDGRNAGRYFPVGIMKPGLVSWLDRAIVMGRVPEGRFLLYGPLDHFPFHDTRDGHFEVRFRAEGLKLAYHPRWPALEEASGTVRFHNNSLEVALEESRLLDSRVRDARARIPSLHPLAPVKISGTVEGPLTDELRILRETPLRDRLARHVEGIELQGTGRLQAELEIPFHGEDYRFQGRLEFRNARFLWTAHALALEKLSGTLHIDNRGLHGRDIRGRVPGGEVVLSVQPEGGVTRITAEGEIDVEALARRFPALQPLAARGRTRARLDLELPNAGDPAAREILLRVRSDLEGVRLDLPPPLAKEAGETLPLDLGLHLQERRQQTTLRLGSALGLTLSRGEGRPAHLALTLSRLPLRPWLRWLDGLEQAGGGPAVERLHLKAGTLEADPLRAEAFVLALDRTGGNWKGTLEGSTLRGRLRLAPEGKRQRLHLDLDLLQLATDPEAQAAEGRADPDGAAPDPRRLALLSLEARRFRFNDADLGRLQIRTEPSPRGQRIERLALEGGIATLEARGDWEAAESGQRTRLAGSLESDDAGRFLREALRLDFLAGSHARLDFDLQWPGPPHAFSLARLHGRMQLDMTAGRFLDIRPGAARILGLLNVRTLGRRLQLDFKDLYQQGMAFDTILGTFRLEDGQVYTNDLEISAPASVIRIAGSTSLTDHTHDQLVTVSPRLDATLPVAGAIAGGPVAGLVVLIAQQAFSGKLEEIQSVRYSVTGPWDDPLVEPLQPPEPPPDEPAPTGGLEILDQ